MPASSGYEDLQLTPNKTYWYKVRTCNAGHSSGPSEEDGKDRRATASPE